MAADEQRDVLERIADALERLSPPPAKSIELDSDPAYYWDGDNFNPIEKFDPVPIEFLAGIDVQKKQLIENSARHASGHAAHDVLLWGSRGMGKSALAKSVLKSLQDDGGSIALIETSSDHLDSLPKLFQILGRVQRPFILFIDDISFDADSAAPRLLRSMLEGGASQRPANVRLYVTSNRRHIVSRSMSEQNDPLNPRDIVDDKLALSDRFGLRLGFHAASQDDFLAMVKKYAEAYGLTYAEEDALLWSKQRGSRSGRVAWQYIVELAGRAGKALN